MKKLKDILGESGMQPVSPGDAAWIAFHPVHKQKYAEGTPEADDKLFNASNISRTSKPDGKPVPGFNPKTVKGSEGPSKATTHVADGIEVVAGTDEVALDESAYQDILKRIILLKQQLRNGNGDPGNIKNQLRDLRQQRNRIAAKMSDAKAARESVEMTDDEFFAILEEYEAAELELDEVSKGAVCDYVKRAADGVNGPKAANRAKGLQNAAKKLLGGAKVPVKEDVLDEGNPQNKKLKNAVAAKLGEPSQAKKDHTLLLHQVHRSPNPEKAAKASILRQSLSVGRAKQKGVKAWEETEAEGETIAEGMREDYHAIDHAHAFASHMHKKMDHEEQAQMHAFRLEDKNLSCPKQKGYHKSCVEGHGVLAKAMGKMAEHHYSQIKKGK